MAPAGRGRRCGVPLTRGRTEAGVGWVRDEGLEAPRVLVLGLQYYPGAFSAEQGV